MAVSLNLAALFKLECLSTSLALTECVCSSEYLKTDMMFAYFDQIFTDLKDKFTNLSL